MPTEHHILIAIGVICGTALIAGSYFITYILGWGNGWEEAVNTAANYPDEPIWRNAMWNARIHVQAESKPCVACGSGTIQICENCEAPLCYDCDSKSYHDVLTCKDEAGCEKRCAANESKA